jgi:hypothetical protein
MFPANGENVKLGKGALMLDLYDENSAPTGLQFVGNATAIGLSTTIKNAELFSSTDAAAGLVARDRTSIAYEVTATLSEYTLNNLQLFLLGEQADAVQVGEAGEKILDGVMIGRYYELGARRVTDVVVNKGSGSDVMVSGTDYDVNSEYGVVFIRTGGSLADEDYVRVSFTKPALTIKTIKIGKASGQLARLVYMADDANSKSKVSKDRLEIWKVDVAPNGELNLIGTDYGSFQLSMPVLDDGANHPDEPYGHLERAVAA